MTAPATGALSDLRLRLALHGAVARELARWRALGHVPALWWRDDDARAPGAALDRLLALAGDRPLALAVVPEGDLRPLAARLAGHPAVTVGQHGVDHIDRRTDAGEARSEYVAGASTASKIAAIRAARAVMVSADLTPAFYAPPWNALAPRFAEILRAAGHERLSAGADDPAHGAMPYAGTEVDILRWKGPVRYRGHGKVVRALLMALRTRRLNGDWGQPIGLLTHHLDHDAAAWRFLEQFLPFADDRFIWMSVAEAARESRGRAAGARQGYSAAA